jgi:hypothetical protein
MFAIEYLNALHNALNRTRIATYEPLSVSQEMLLSPSHEYLFHLVHCADISLLYSCALTCNCYFLISKLLFSSILQRFGYFTSNTKAALWWDYIFSEER